MATFIEHVREAGVVGAGGAGFPTYKKLDAKAEIVIANGAECEPLLYKDQRLMEHFPEEIIRGLLLVMQHMGAREGIIAIKAKNKHAIQAIGAHLPGSTRIYEMADVYPAGDEYEVVYHATGRRIPAGGLPLDVGVVVQNVETLYNICRANQGAPVTHSMMTIHGHVARPLTAWFPVGMPYADLLDFAGGATVDDFVLIDGGPMMGKVVTDLSKPVTRTSGGFIVLPRSTKLAVRKSHSESAFKRIGKSACDQCSLCTDMCPRYLLGYPIQPHLVMRSLLTSGPMSQSLTHWAQACCECNICSLWACPEELDPRNVCATTKRDLKRNDQWLDAEQLQRLSQEVHPLKEYRSVPTKRLQRRLGLDRFTEDAPFCEEDVRPARVHIPLQQHIGVAPRPVVKIGDVVEFGQVIARPAGDELSVPAHASIAGVVRSIDEAIVIDKQTQG